jgi:N-acetyl sugar amidotransferase
VKKHYQVCTRCVMDTSAENIVFDEQGICNYCSDFTIVLEQAKLSAADSIAAKDQFIEKVKESGRGKQYDCIVGVSGGVDSSYALYLAVKLGLRPLAVHLDNGWNSELATHNIANLVKSLGVDLHTHVIDWNENRDLQRSFFAAHVVDIELLMDNAMMAINYQQAAKYGLTYILAGMNISTEGMNMPPGWNHFKRDAKNIRAIQKRYGTVSIKTHPLLSVLDYIWFERFRKIKWTSFLDYFPFVKLDAIEILKAECAYRPYPYKHYESIFTRFYQAYILPKKFGIDKRRLHLSTLVVSGQMSRDEAIEMLKSDPYPDPKQMEQDKTFVLKKLGFTEQGFDEYIAAVEIPHAVYGTEEPLQNNIAAFYRLLFKRASQ